LIGQSQRHYCDDDFGFAAPMSKRVRLKKLRVIMLADARLLPAGELKDYSEKQRELRKTEFDVRDAIEQLGHEVFSIGVSDDLSTIRGGIDAHKPHVAFNLVEEFDGIGHFDQHIVSYLELRKQPYTGCNPRGLTLARDKALTKKNPCLSQFENSRVCDLCQKSHDKAASRIGISAVREVTHRRGLGWHFGRVDRAR
jgi:hypothetical protein